MAKGDDGALERVKQTAAEATGGAGGVLDALKSKELLTSAALGAVSAIAAAKGPDIAKRLTGATEQKGGQAAEKLGRDAAEGAQQKLQGSGGLAGKALSKLMGGGGGDDSGGAQAKKTRRLPIERWTDVAVPVDKAYEAWTKFDDFPRFMHRVLDVERRGRDEVQWREKIWFSTREWEGRITDRRKNDRIAWETTSGMSHRGVVSFHPLANNLTRVMVTMEFEPQGMVEKMASGLRFVKRAVQSDLARFKAYVEMEHARGIEYRPTDGDSEADADQGPTRSRSEEDEGRGARRRRESGQKESRKGAASR